ncbi:MAG: hypothetical protein SCH70_14170, partial [Candidatus Methanoperedens sp.]|nr:hypothetical protein [Candidatus Methanoperedens sp.]
MPEVTSLLNSLKPELHIHAIASDRMDMLTFKDLKNKSSNLQEVETDGVQALKTFSPLMQDIWSGLYKYTPELKAPAEMAPSHALNRELVERMTQTQQYKELRLHTRLDDLHSAMATVTMSSNLAEKLKTELKDQADNANKMHELEESISSESAKAMAYRDMALQCKDENERAGLEEKATASEKQAQSLKKQIPIMAHLINKSREAAANKMRCAVRNAADEALGQADELSNTMDGWGIGQGSVQNLPIEDKIGLAKLLQTEKLKKMAQLLGRLRRLAIHKQKTKLIQARDEIHSITRGNDISRLLPQELGLLRHPLAKNDFQKRFLEHDLAQYDLKGTERTGKGPVIVCVDNSGSMSGDREVWSKAVALALLEIASMQKRHYVCIHFGSAIQALEITEIAPGDPDTFRKAVSIASYFLGGGTDFKKPLSASCELIQKSQYNKADIV